MNKYCLVILVLFCAAVLQAQEQYNNEEAGFRFSYPQGTALYDSWQKELKTPGDYFIFVYVDKLPLTGELNLGYNNYNIKRLKEGLKSGKITGMPFYYRSLSGVFPVSGGYAIENYTLSWYTDDNILFETRIAFFCGDYVVSIWISAEAYHKQIIEHYLGSYFEDRRGYYFWNHEKDRNKLVEMMELIKKRDIPAFDGWMNIIEAVKNSLTITP